MPEKGPVLQKYCPPQKQDCWGAKGSSAPRSASPQKAPDVLQSHIHTFCSQGTHKSGASCRGRKGCLPAFCSGLAAALGAKPQARRYPGEAAGLGCWRLRGTGTATPQHPWALALPPRGRGDVQSKRQVKKKERKKRTTKKATPAVLYLP